jgi:hypothetical protein
MRPGICQLTPDELQFQNHMYGVKDGSQSMSARTQAQIDQSTTEGLISYSHVSVWALIKNLSARR